MIPFLLINQTMKFLAAVLTLFGLASCDGKTVQVDLSGSWDDKKVLKNPDKGWYHHHLDNSITYYGVQEDSELDDFPNLHHLFIRLPWAYFEPNENQYDWSWIDKNVKHWVNKGYKLSLSFTCHETNLPFATPRWVYESGVKGRFLKSSDHEDLVWEPDYDDPLFLKYLEDFLKEVSRRYRKEPWLNDISIGTIGQWGEGHSAGPNQPTAHQVMEHLKLHVKHFSGNQIIANDDMINAAKTPEERTKLHAFCVENRITYRDDSVFWEGDMEDPSVPFSIRNDDFFRDAWQYAPTTLESCHFNYVLKKNYWVPPDGGKRFWDTYVGAVKTAHATFVGYHHYAGDFLRKNPALANHIANLAGYWYFPVKVVYPRSLAQGEDLNIQLDMLNKGAAKSYKEYDIVARLISVSDAASYEFRAPSFSNKWLPHMISKNNNYRFPLTDRPPPGEYELYLGMATSEGSFQKRPVYWALKDELLRDGLYLIGKISLQ